MAQKQYGASQQTLTPDGNTAIQFQFVLLDILAKLLQKASFIKSFQIKIVHKTISQ